MYRGEIVGASGLPVIVEEPDFRRARAIMTDPRRRTLPETVVRSLLAGVLVCGVCGSRVGSHNRYLAPGVARRPGYACRESRCVTRSRRLLDEAVCELVVEDLASHLEHAPEGAQGGRRARPEGIRRRRGAAIELTQLQELMAGGELDPADYAVAARGLRERLVDARTTRVGRHAGTPATAKLLQSSYVEAAWEAAPHPTKRAVIAEVVESITLPRGTPGRFTMSGTKVRWRARGDSDALVEILGDGSST